MKGKRYTSETEIRILREAEKRIQLALDDIQRKQRQLEWDLTQQQRNLDQWNQRF
jgi:hypothetical protein